MRLDVADDHFLSLGLLLPSGLQHGVGLADAGGVAEEDPQHSAPRLRLVRLHLRQQRVGIGTLIFHKLLLLTSR